MENIKIELKFEPDTLKAYAKNEAEMKIKINNTGEELVWCECDIGVTSPLSLAHDRELDVARTRVGIVRPKSSMEKRVRLYTRPNNFPDEYKVHVTTFAYGEDGAITERNESYGTIVCRDEKENAGQ
ncbi:MAG: hypothetical protein QXR58_00965 [Candidatus Micrarchaeaceae archaeon]